MFNLDSPINKVPKVGPTFEKLLNKLNIYTVEDLLYHIPFRYEDYSQVKSIADLIPNEEVTIEATLEKIENIYSKTGKKLTKAWAADLTGKIEMTWFNQHYLKNTLKVGNSYYFSGKTQEFARKITLVAPVFEEVKENTLNTGRLVPVYSETKGISSKWLRSRINDVTKVLKYKNEIKEYLPEITLNRHSLITLDKSLYQIHFPENEAQIFTAKERLAFGELLLELLKVQERKETWNTKYEGLHLDYKKHQKQIEKFIQNLPFALTETQSKAIAEIAEDLEQAHPMNRLLEGDVGSGKTIVAIAIAYLSHLEGYKTLYMAPTEILAKQHYQTFKNFLSDFDVDIKLTTGTTKEDIHENEDSIIIGTHALLFEKKPITNVGLVIIDEQHRFGVEQRTKIAQMGANGKKPNLLTMTATPIPRTLALTLYGDLEISVLDAVPNKDKKITTKVVYDKNREKVFEWIRQKGEQTFIVCPFIEESDHEAFENVKAAQTEYEKLKNGVFKGLNVGLLHGKMKNDEKQTVMNDFREGKIQILVSTPVIEVGVDVPEATIIVIESAERYGLASLHQLRGRVGRGKKEGFCFIFMSQFTRPSFERLKNLEQIDNGLQLAEIDMEYRGQGDIFGTQQHGFKQFKVADITNIKILERAKTEAEVLYPQLNDHKLLKQKLESMGLKYIGNN